MARGWFQVLQGKPFEGWEADGWCGWWRPSHPPFSGSHWSLVDPLQLTCPLGPLALARPPSHSCAGLGKPPFLREKQPLRMLTFRASSGPFSLWILRQFQEEAQDPQHPFLLFARACVCACVHVPLHHTGQETRQVGQMSKVPVR